LILAKYTFKLFGKTIELSIGNHPCVLIPRKYVTKRRFVSPYHIGVVPKRKADILFCDANRKISIVPLRYDIGRRSTVYVKLTMKEKGFPVLIITDGGLKVVGSFEEPRQGHTWNIIGIIQREGAIKVNFERMFETDLYI